LGEIRKVLPPADGKAPPLLTPHASLSAKKFFEPSAQYGGRNEGVRGEYSGSWLASFPAFTAGLSGDWPDGKLYPVTAARLLPIFTEFLASTRNLQISQRTESD